MHMAEQISPSEFLNAEGSRDWRIISDGACAYYRTHSFAAGARFVDAIAALPDLDRNHPDVDIRHDGVTVRLITVTSDAYGVSTRDVELAAQISAIAADQGLAAEPSRIQSLLIVPGAPDTAAVM